MNYKQAKKYLKVTDAEVSNILGFKNALSYTNSESKEKLASVFTATVALLKDKEEQRIKEAINIYQKACKTLKTVSIDANDFIKYLNRLK